MHSIHRLAPLVLLLLLGCETMLEEAPPREVTPLPVSAPQAAPDVSVKPRAHALLAKEEIGSRQFRVDPGSEAALSAARLRFSDSKSELLRHLAEQPTAQWFTAANLNVFQEAQKLAAAVKGTSQYAVLVIKGLPQRDCNQFQTPGLAPDAYRAWIQSIAQGLGETPVYIILEPDAILLTACWRDQEKKDLFAQIAESILVLKKNSKAQVYIDAGHPERLPLDDVVARLFEAGVLTADGFALNVGDYQWTDDCIRYGQAISEKIGGKGFVIDTARNGKGPVSREAWCNPRNRAIGQSPQAPTGIKGLDAYLWLTPPGISDGTCNGGPASGQWWQAKAIELMRNAELPD